MEFKHMKYAHGRAKEAITDIRRIVGVEGPSGLPLNLLYIPAFPAFYAQSLRLPKGLREPYAALTSTPYISNHGRMKGAERKRTSALI